MGLKNGETMLWLLKNNGYHWQKPQISSSKDCNVGWQEGLLLLIVVGRASELGRCHGMAEITSSGYSTVKGLLYYSLLLAGTGAVTQTSPQWWGMPEYEIWWAHGLITLAQPFYVMVKSVNGL